MPPRSRPSSASLSPTAPEFTQPTLAARQLATLDRLSGGRVAVHIITGGADEEMARDGDTSTKEERYQRTDEYLTILRQEWTAETPFDHTGRFYNVRQAFASIKPKNLPVFFGGSSDSAIEVAGRHADVYALWGETLADVREVVSRVRAAAARHGRNPGFSLSLRPVIADTVGSGVGSAPTRSSIGSAICARRRAQAQRPCPAQCRFAASAADRRQRLSRRQEAVDRCRRARRGGGQFHRSGRHARTGRRCDARLL